jgi:hypothetical protein
MVQIGDLLADAGRDTSASALDGARFMETITTQAGVENRFDFDFPADSAERPSDNRSQVSPVPVRGR